MRLVLSATSDFIADDAAVCKLLLLGPTPAPTATKYVNTCLASTEVTLCSLSPQ